MAEVRDVNMKRWEIKDTLWLIAVLALGGVLFVTVKYGRDIDTISVISISAGIASIVLAICAIIQSFIYDQRSAATYQKMDEKLESIDSKQDLLYDVIDGAKTSIDVDPAFTKEVKAIIKKILDKVSDEYYSGIGKTIQNEERATVAEKVEKDLEETIQRRRGELKPSHNEFVDLEAIYRNTNLYFTYSIRNTVAGENWPQKNVMEFFNRRVETYVSNEARLKGVWVIFIVYSDSIYYYIVNNKMDSPAQDKLSLKDKDVLKNKEWTDLLMNKIDEYIGSIAGI